MLEDSMAILSMVYKAFWGFVTTVVPVSRPEFPLITRSVSFPVTEELKISREPFESVRTFALIPVDAS
ncbi:hypothetical protein D3C84_775490 [compost metagenome]